MSEELEKQWYEEGEKSFNEQDNGTGYYGGGVNYIEGYVAGRKAAQDEIEDIKRQWITYYDNNKEIESLKAQLAEKEVGIVCLRSLYNECHATKEELKATLVKSIDALSHYANRMDSGGTARRAITEIKEVLK
jgi:hypothetical protein